ncbi:Uncharacterized protein FWK35_00013930 [Aphis craccivora]|uniref:Uncharacterized protein n=1 Tax=Aphis craccivora TaxID=307492 RepID=A0A6G0Z4X1_APHCR|nr:Uncharacterized protein FWK35_00013930 [Aphis craccivora]
MVNNSASTRSNPNDTSNNGNWTVQTNKRNLSSSSAPNSTKTPSKPTKKKKNIFATANRFDVLSQPDNDNDKINDNHNTC